MDNKPDGLTLKSNTPPWSAENVITATITGFVIAIMTVVVTWNALPHHYIYAWLVSVSSMFGIGVFSAFLYQQNKQGLFSSKSLIIFSSVIFGLLWSMPGTLLFLGGHNSTVLMYSLAVIVMLSWASFYFSAIRFQYLAFSIPFVSPLLIQLVVNKQEQYLLAGVIVVALLIMMVSARSTHLEVQKRFNLITGSLTNLFNYLTMQIQVKQNTISEVIDSEQHLRELTDASFEGIVIHEYGKILDVNKAFINMVGITYDEAIGSSILDFIHMNSTDLGTEKVLKKSFGSFEVTGLQTDGSNFPLELHVRTGNYNGKPVSIVAMRDITDRKFIETDIIRLSNIDLLTGLPNRKKLQESLVSLIEEANTQDQLFALLIVDIDNFKLINETLGHEVGDELLQYVSRKISETVRGHDLLARWGDDEFAVILNKVENNEEVEHVTKRIQHALGEFIILRDHEIYVSASIGCTVYADSNQSLEGLIGNAEIAVSRAKENGHNSIDIYTSDSSRKTSERYELENDLRKAIENCEFELHYQPKINLSTCKVIGVEALIRWRHPIKGLISPMEFIPLAEQTGLIVPIGAWVLDEACKQINAWKNHGLEPVPIAINLSLRQLKNINMLDVIMSTLARHNVAPELLEVEITESSVAENFEQAVRLMDGLSAAGVTIAIDDFGTGYSSLSYLKKFPVDYLKIDRSFIKYIPDDVDDTAITATIIVMAENLGLKVIAEGVETQAQLNFIQKKGCYSAQGFLISKPLPEKFITQWLHNPPSTLDFNNHGNKRAQY